ncbi:unnamed protein product [Meloidogyne enterolobii]|uniref:Uncharacterized protein n=1 Tax=Meloidogyne enterolobii TaxID=390850 RepID=A0ACB0YGH5_MELEN
MHTYPFIPPSPQFTHGISYTLISFIIPLYPRYYSNPHPSKHFYISQKKVGLLTLIC